MTAEEAQRIATLVNAGILSSSMPQDAIEKLAAHLTDEDVTNLLGLSNKLQSNTDGFVMEHHRLNDAGE